MFSDEWDEATPTSLEPAGEETEVRGRSGSNSSEKMGRFEVRSPVHMYNSKECQ